MGKKKDIYRVIDSVKTDPAYTMTAFQIFEIANHSEDRYSHVYDGFRFGYLQGMKAAKAERRRTV